MLPKIEVPLYELTLPLTKKTIKYRPFLVKEEKILLMAVEGQDEKSTLLAIKQIVNNCVLDTLDVDNLPMTDLEFIFLNLRARSVGEVVELQYKCNNKTGELGLETPCGNVMKFNVNLLEIKPEFPEGHTNNIKLSDNVGIVLKYPSFKNYEKVDTKNSEIEIIIDILLDCIDYIYDQDTLYYAKDSTRVELQEYIEGLTQDQFKKIQEFFSSIPKIKTKIDFKCDKCGYTETFEVEGLQSFFS